MTKEKLSIDELARRLCNEWVGKDDKTVHWTAKKRKYGTHYSDNWQRVARLARKLEAQPAAKKPRPTKPKPLVCEACGKSKRDVCERATFEGEVFISCEPCWCSVPAKVFNKRVAAHRAKAAAKKRGMQ